MQPKRVATAQLQSTNWIWALACSYHLSFFSFGLIRTISVPKCPFLDRYQFSCSWLYQGSTHRLVRVWLEFTKPQNRWSNPKTGPHLEKAFFSRSPVFYFFQLPIFLLRFIPLLVIVTTFELNKSLQNIICHISTNTMVEKGQSFFGEVIFGHPGTGLKAGGVFHNCTYVVELNKKGNHWNFSEWNRKSWFRITLRIRGQKKTISRMISITGIMLSRHRLKFEKDFWEKFMVFSPFNFSWLVESQVRSL